MVGPTLYASASLYVGDLSPDVNETILFEIFSSIGPVASIRVCRESGTRKSLGYAYVNYHSMGDAERCLETLNYTPIKGIPCRIMWSHRDPSLRRSGAGNIFIKNLDRVIDNKALHDTFSLFGNILSCKVAMDEYGKSKGYGFVHYESEHSAKLAIERVNGMPIGSKKVYVGPFKKQVDRPSIRNSIFTNLYVKHFPNEWTESILRDLFSQYGAIKTMVLTEDPKGRRFSLVNFEDTSSARRALQELHGRRTNLTGVEPPDEISQKAVAEAENEPPLHSHETSETLSSHSEDFSQKYQDVIKEGEKNSTTTTTDKKEVQAQDATTQQQHVEDEKKVDKEQQHSSTTSKHQEPSHHSSTKITTDDGTASGGLSEDRLYVQRAMTKAERIAMLKETFNLISKDNKASGGVNLYVKNLDDQVTDEMLKEAFSRFGTVTSSKIMRDESDVSRGFGFVCFAFPEDATRAVTAMHLKLFHGKPLYVGLAEKRYHRLARLQQRYRMSNHHMQTAQSGRLPMGSGGTTSAMNLTAAPQQALGTTTGMGHSNIMMISQSAAAGGGATAAAGGGASVGGGNIVSGGPTTHMMTYPSGPTGAPPPSMYYAAQPGGAATTDRHHGLTAPPPSSGVGGYAASQHHPSAITWRRSAHHQPQIISPTTVGAPPAATTPRYPYAYNNDTGGSQMMQQPLLTLRSQQPTMRSQQPAGNSMAARMAAATRRFPMAAPIPQSTNQNFKFTSQARNRQDYIQQPLTMIQQPTTTALHSNDPISAQVLADATPQMQKQMLGERLFPLVHKHQPELAGKITGMMLEMDNTELLSLLESETLLCAKVEEALGVLHRHHQAATTGGGAAGGGIVPPPTPTMLSQQ